MGFATAVAVPDGIAIASDSRLQAGLMGGPPATMSDTQQKIVELSPFVGAIVPEPYILAEEMINVRSLLENIRHDLARDAHLEQVLDELPGRLLTAAGSNRELFEDYQVVLVGFSAEDRDVKTAIIRELDEPDLRHSTAQPGIDWFGFGDFATRLVKEKTSITIEGVPEGPDVEYLIPTQVMSLDDALDFAETLVQTSATFAKFVQAVIPPTDVGPQPIAIAVGGPVQSAVVTPRGFHWVKRPRWATTTPEPESLGPDSPLR